MNIAKRFREVKETLGMNNDIHIHRKLNKQNKIINSRRNETTQKKIQSAVNSTYIAVIMQKLNNDLIRIVT